MDSLLSNNFLSLSLSSLCLGLEFLLFFSFAFFSLLFLFFLFILLQYVLSRSCLLTANNWCVWSFLPLSISLYSVVAPPLSLSPLCSAVISPPTFFLSILLPFSLSLVLGRLQVFSLTRVFFQIITDQYLLLINLQALIVFSFYCISYVSRL